MCDDLPILTVQAWLLAAPAHRSFQVLSMGISAGHHPPCQVGFSGYGAWRSRFRWSCGREAGQGEAGEHNGLLFFEGGAKNNPFFFCLFFFFFR